MPYKSRLQLHLTWMRINKIIWTFLGKFTAKLGTLFLLFYPLVKVLLHLFLPRLCAILKKFWRKEGIKIRIYTDKFLRPTFSPLDLALEESEIIRNSLTHCGFIKNSEKPVWQPQKELIWLTHSNFTIPEDQIV